MACSFEEDLRYNKLIDQESELAKRFRDSFKEFKNAVSESYRKKHSTEYKTAAFEFKKILEASGFRARIIPLYHAWFATIVSTKYL